MSLAPPPPPPLTAVSDSTQYTPSTATTSSPASHVHGARVLPPLVLRPLKALVPSHRLLRRGDLDGDRGGSSSSRRHLVERGDDGPGVTRRSDVDVVSPHLPHEIAQVVSVFRLVGVVVVGRELDRLGGSASDRGCDAREDIPRPLDAHARDGHRREPHARGERDGFRAVRACRVVVEGVEDDGNDGELSRRVPFVAAFVATSTGGGGEVGGVDGRERSTRAFLERRARLALRGCPRGLVPVPGCERREHVRARGRRGGAARGAGEEFFQRRRELRARRRGDARRVVEDVPAGRDGRLDRLQIRARGAMLPTRVFAVERAEEEVLPVVVARRGRGRDGQGREVGVHHGAVVRGREILELLLHHEAHGRRHGARIRVRGGWDARPQSLLDRDAGGGELLPAGVEEERRRVDRLLAALGSQHRDAHGRDARVGDALRAEVRHREVAQLGTGHRGLGARTAV